MKHFKEHSVGRSVSMAFKTALVQNLFVDSFFFSFFLLWGTLSSLYQPEPQNANIMLQPIFRYY